MNRHISALFFLCVAGGFFWIGLTSPGDARTSATNPDSGPGFSDPYFGIVYPDSGKSIGFAATECVIRLPPGKLPVDAYHVYWNDKDITPLFRPFAPRPIWGKGGWRLAAMLDLLHSGRLGDNRLEIREENQGNWRTVDAVVFRFEPYPLRLDFNIREKGALTGSTRLPARLTFWGIEGTPTPNFLHETNARHNAFNRIHFVSTATGSGSILVPEGRYKVIVSRGPEYTASQAVLQGRGTRRKEFILERVVDTSGYLSADFHVHSILSPDSHIPFSLRALSFAAAGVEFLVMTDHLVLAKLSPILRQYDLTPWLRSAVGTEVDLNPDKNSGHWNAFPFEISENEVRIPNLHRQIGRLELTEPFEFFDWVRQVERLPGQNNSFFAESFRDFEIPLTEGGRLIQLNHPRGIQMKSEDWPFAYFQAIDFDPDCDESVQKKGRGGPVCQATLFRFSRETGTSNLDFDLIELYNRTSLELYRKVRSDWFWLLNRGIFKVGTANTDTHSLNAGYPRNFVRVGEGRDRPDRVDPQEVFFALRSGANLGSTGPFIHLSATDSGRDQPVAYLGDQLRAPSGKVRLRLRVEAPPWVPVEEVRIYLNGEVVKRFHGETNPGLSFSSDPFGEGPVVRLETEVELSVTRDSWIVVEAGGKEEGKEQTENPVLSVYRRITLVQSPIAFTNPIFVNIEKNGEFDPGNPPGKSIRQAGPIFRGHF